MPSVSSNLGKTKEKLVFLANHHNRELAKGSKFKFDQEFEESNCNNLCSNFVINKLFVFEFNFVAKEGIGPSLNKGKFTTVDE
ncbi:hypothetical protein EPI10_022875 [Gossypium australe]|uniref:Uncharacterized protein n=1 Tax=Gossypium australe TaxID=47621 RepID=A0A5B6VTY3_9ROSI|nr:hypothetical protein EPI10_022875 [Gossypium australe]